MIFDGNEYIEEKISNLNFRIYPKSFFQTNIDQTLELYRVIKKFANHKGDELLSDLYSGLGTISQFIADDSKKVIGIKEITNLLNKRCTLEHAKELIAIKTRQYAKRQATWARGQMQSWQKINPKNLGLALKKLK